MIEKKFDPKKLDRLNNPQRLIDISLDYIWDKLNLEKSDVLVEIGAGTAFFSIAFLKQAKASEIKACDLSNVMIDWIKENVVPNYPNIQPVKTEENSIPLDDGIADLVYMINLHHELDDPNKMIKESYRILKPGGKIFIVDWKKENMTQGPPTEIRYFPENVMKQLQQSKFSNTLIPQLNYFKKNQSLVQEILTQ
jgi:ubiquinone/menaquinone biosynthesis C-methylase UbiE